MMDNNRRVWTIWQSDHISKMVMPSFGSLHVVYVWQRDSVDETTKYMFLMK